MAEWPISPTITLTLQPPSFATLLLRARPLALYCHIPSHTGSSRLQVALKHEMKVFLSQPVVHDFMRAEWIGGGINELRFGDAWDLRKVPLHTVAYRYMPLHPVTYHLINELCFGDAWQLRKVAALHVSTAHVASITPS